MINTRNVDDQTYSRDLGNLMSLTQDWNNARGLFSRFTITGVSVSFSPTVREMNSLRGNGEVVSYKPPFYVCYNSATDAMTAPPTTVLSIVDFGNMKKLNAVGTSRFYY